MKEGLRHLAEITSFLTWGTAVTLHINLRKGHRMPCRSWTRCMNRQTCETAVLAYMHLVRHGRRHR